MKINNIVVEQNRQKAISYTQMIHTEDEKNGAAFLKEKMLLTQTRCLDKSFKCDL